MTSNILHINSRDRDASIYPNVNKFKIQLNRTMKNISVARLISSSIVNDSFTIPTNKTTMIMTVNGNTDLVVNLTAGYYTLSELMSHIQSTVKSAIDAYDNATTILTISNWTVSQASPTDYLSVVNDTYDFTFQISSASWTLPLNLIGMPYTTTSDSSSASLAWTSLIPPDVLPTKYWFIKLLPLDQVVFSSNTGLKCNFVIPCSSNKNTKNIVYASYEMVNRFNPIDLNYIEVEILDETGELVPIKSDWMIVIELA